MMINYVKDDEIISAKEHEKIYFVEVTTQFDMQSYK